MAPFGVTVRHPISSTSSSRVGQDLEALIEASRALRLLERVNLRLLGEELEAEVEVGQRLDRRRPAGTHSGLQTAAVAQRDWGGQEPLDHFRRDLDGDRRTCAAVANNA